MRRLVPILALTLAACTANPIPPGPAPAPVAPLAAVASPAAACAIDAAPGSACRPIASPAVAPTTPRGAGADIAIAADALLPPEVAADPALVAVYRWAAANRDLLAYMPCTCGCDAEGHRSNADCYIRAVRAPADVDWDLHGVGCSTCQAITGDAKDRLAAGEDATAIRAAIEAKFVPGGPTTLTPWPSASP